jgi:NADH dehydrogenase [ubiquinone] 1 alpha subcomplex assembly factor 5
MADAAPRIFDRAAYRARRERAGRARGDIFFASEAAAQIGQRLSGINRRFICGLDLNSRARVFPALEPWAESWVRVGYASETPTVVADEDALPFAEASFDLVVSVLSLHAVNDLPGALVQIRRALKPDGLFVAALFAAETLNELRLSFAAAEAEILGGASSRVAPFADVRELGHLLQRAGFALPVADVERTTVRYRQLPKLFADLRGLGETNVLTGRRTSFLSRRTMERLIAEYGSRFPDDEGRFPATFEISFLTGWAPHSSQQQPLRPGSAKARLADALGTVEQKAGEKASPRPAKP